MPYERMLDKQHEPDAAAIAAHIGPKAQALLEQTEQQLRGRYDLKRELRFPFGNEYGWGYKYSHKAKHLLYLFFEREALTAMLQLGDGAAVEAILPGLSPYAKGLWENRYPCGQKGGGWMHYRITDPAQLGELMLLAGVKYKPVTK